MIPLWLAIPLGLMALGIAAFPAAAWICRGPYDDLPVAMIRLLNSIYIRCYHRLRWAPADPIPLEGPAIVVANHRSGVDPLALEASTKRTIRFLMAREYYEIPGLRWLFRTIGTIPVNRDGKDLGATKAALRILREGGVVGIFPQGGLRPSELDEEGRISGKSGVALLALRSGAPIVPAYIEGTPAHESIFRAVLTPSRSRIIFGEPFRLEPGPKKASREEIEAAAERILARIALLHSLGRDAAGG